MTTGKTIALTVWTFFGKVMSLLLNVLFIFFIAFLPRSKHLLISWLQSPSTVFLEPKKIVHHCFYCLPIYLPWDDGTGWHDLVFWILSFKVPTSHLFYTWQCIHVNPIQFFPYIIVKNEGVVIPRQCACNWSQWSLDGYYYRIQPTDVKS